MNQERYAIIHESPFFRDFVCVYMSGWDARLLVFVIFMNFCGRVKKQFQYQINKREEGGCH